MRTTFMANDSTVERSWYVIDAKGERLGRIASLAATLLRGKHKPTFTPHVDCGDNVIIINAKQVELTGNKLTQKMYYRHSMYPGGLKSRTALEMRKNHPGKMMELAIKGMLPKGSLGSKMIKKLHVYATDVHPHQAQKPEILQVTQRKENDNE